MAVVDAAAIPARRPAGPGLGVIRPFDAMRTPGPAIIVCLAISGLRALCLEDLHWRAGTVHLRTREDASRAVLPLPREAGSAVVAYLRGARPMTDERHVFVQQIGPRHGVRPDNARGGSARTTSCRDGSRSRASTRPLRAHHRTSATPTPRILTPGVASGF